jgi:cytochrome P450
MRFDDIPMLAGGATRFGHTELLNADRLALMRQVADTGHELVRLRMPAQVVVAANGPRSVYDVLVGEARSFQKSPILRTGLYPLAGDGLFTSEGALWRQQRKLMSPLFRQRALEGYAAAMAGCAEHAQSEWRDGEVLDIARETTRIAMSVAGKTLFDADTFSDADELGAALTTALNWVNDQIASPVLILQAYVKTKLMVASHRVPAPLSSWLMRGADALHKPIIVPGERARRLRAALDVLERRVDRMIADRRHAAEPTPDLLTALLAAHDEEGARMSDKQVRDEILTLFIAGHETTASGLAWSLYLLARHPEAYRRAQAEADAIVAPHIGVEHLAQLGYCSRVFKEALRLYAPIYMFGRQAMEPVTIAGYDIPRGTIMLLCPYALHHRADLWPEPDRFDPGRFTHEAEQARPREAYLPFSGGPRTCIGNHFALMEGPIVLATLMRHASFATLSDDEVIPEAATTLRPKGGIPMRVTLRTAPDVAVAAGA